MRGVWCVVGEPTRHKHHTSLLPPTPTTTTYAHKCEASAHGGGEWERLGASHRLAVKVLPNRTRHFGFGMEALLRNCGD